MQSALSLSSANPRFLGEFVLTTALRSRSPLKRTLRERASWLVDCGGGHDRAKGGWEELDTSKGGLGRCVQSKERRSAKSPKGSGSPPVLWEDGGPEGAGLHSE